jgi:hypothetical protein
MQITNTNSQLKIVHSGNNEYYKYQTFKSISWALDAKGYYVLINFIANDKNNSLRLYMVDITNQGSWTNNVPGATAAVDQIATWAGIAPSNVTPTSKQPAIIRSTGTALTYIPSNLSSISFASVGTASATVVVNGTSIQLKVGETISYDAGAINNFMIAYSFAYDTTAAGSELLIIYVL